MTVSIKIEGVQQVKKFINQKSKEAVQGMTKGVARASIYVQGEVKQSIAGKRAEHISVDTSRFLNSVGISLKKKQSIVYSGLPYARKLEYGTDFKNSPRKHFRNSADRSKQKVREILTKEITNAISKGARAIKRVV